LGLFLTRLHERCLCASRLAMPIRRC
jgi:hypothetical protein